MRVISGGQSGIDRLSLEVAKALGINTGGFAPKDFLTEYGPDYSLKEFGLIETDSADYKFRTSKNVMYSDGTVIFGNVSSPGSKLTINICKLNDRPYILNPSTDDLVKFVINNNVRVLNVAGNRASKLTEVQLTEYGTILTESLHKIEIYRSIRTMPVRPHIKRYF